mmetsp:Transcript_26796/g.63902  ORF Transcript_26796/g.63902 Transcript_26796/m.63902 type:complete len:114 (+) Transcript_26796:3103-3444(+)
MVSEMGPRYSVRTTKPAKTSKKTPFCTPLLTARSASMRTNAESSNTKMDVAPVTTWHVFAGSTVGAQNSVKTERDEKQRNNIRCQFSECFGPVYRFVVTNLFLKKNVSHFLLR